MKKYSPAELSRIFDDVVGDSGGLYRGVLWLPNAVRERLEREDAFLAAYLEAESQYHVVAKGPVDGA